MTPYDRVLSENDDARRAEAEGDDFARLVYAALAADSTESRTFALSTLLISVGVLPSVLEKAARYIAARAKLTVAAEEIRDECGRRDENDTCFCGRCGLD